MRHYMTVKPWFHGKNMKKQIEKFHKECTKCQKYSSIYIRNLKTEEPFEHISSDIVGPYQGHYFSKNGREDKFYIVTIIDRCTHIVMLKIVFRLHRRHNQYHKILDLRVRQPKNHTNRQWETIYCKGNTEILRRTGYKAQVDSTLFVTEQLGIRKNQINN